MKPPLSPHQSKAAEVSVYVHRAVFHGDSHVGIRERGVIVGASVLSCLRGGWENNPCSPNQRRFGLQSCYTVNSVAPTLNLCDRMT